MVATATANVFTGANAATKSAATTYWNLMSTDAADTTDSGYIAARLTAPTGANHTYSYERWGAITFSDTYNAIENCLFWFTSLMTNTGVTITAGVSASGVTPVNTDSSIATASAPITEGAALNIQNGTMESSPDTTKFVVLQADLVSTVGPGDLTTSAWKVQYDES
jgi:hypothetical protein